MYLYSEPEEGKRWILGPDLGARLPSAGSIDWAYCNDDAPSPDQINQPWHVWDGQWDARSNPIAVHVQEQVLVNEEGILDFT